MCHDCNLAFGSYYKLAFNKPWSVVFSFLPETGMVCPRKLLVLCGVIGSPGYARELPRAAALRRKNQDQESSSLCHRGQD